MSPSKKIWVVTALMAVAAGIAPVWGQGEWETPLTSPVPAELRPVGEVSSSTAPVVSTPAWETREGLEEAARRVLSVPPKVWEGMVKGRRVTRVIVRERGRARVIYAGPRITKSQVNDLIAQWSKRAGFVSKSFVEARDRKVLAEAKKYTDERLAPLEERVTALEQKTKPSVSSLRQTSPWLVLAVVFLIFVIGGCAALIYRYFERRRVF